jgi:hypothetical protein
MQMLACPICDEGVKLTEGNRFLEALWMWPHVVQDCPQMLQYDDEPGKLLVHLTACRDCLDSDADHGIGLTFTMREATEL